MTPASSRPCSIEGLIPEAVERGEVGLSVVMGIGSTTARARHDVAGTRLGQDVVTALENTTERLIGEPKTWRGIATGTARPGRPPRRPPAARLDDPAQGPDPNRGLITTRYTP
ncbi:hypothetical protein ABWJ92_11710 [Streptomyces sp. NPDC000609]|uniref:hypothetical protein n=1 Tax=Streptomyces sp. NPDC000609 TaxID=3160957 RepID=UPI0033952A25